MINQAGKPMDERWSPWMDDTGTFPEHWVHPVPGHQTPQVTFSSDGGIAGC